jgi:hypothetical protein
VSPPTDVHLTTCGRSTALTSPRWQVTRRPYRWQATRPAGHQGRDPAGPLALPPAHDELPVSPPTEVHLTYQVESAPHQPSVGADTAFTSPRLATRPAGRWACDPDGPLAVSPPGDELPVSPPTEVHLTTGGRTVLLTSPRWATTWPRWLKAGDRPASHRQVRSRRPDCFVARWWSDARVAPHRGPPDRLARSASHKH